MAEKAKAPKPGNSAGINQDDAEGFVTRLENLDKDLGKLKSEHMLKCKDVRSDIKEVYKEAEDAGLPKKALKAVVNARALERKAKAEREDLADIDMQSKYDAIRHQLGDYADTPLGAAAVAAVGNGAAEAPAAH